MHLITGKISANGQETAKMTLTNSAAKVLLLCIRNEGINDLLMDYKYFTYAEVRAGKKRRAA